MTLKLYNTMTRKKEEFEPREENQVKFYSCGQTIYDDLHIGNSRPYCVWDIISRYLTWKGYNVFHVQNITDVGHLTDDADQGEDKVEKRAKERGIVPRELVTKQIRRYYRELDELNIKHHDVSPRATGHIPEIIEAVKKIIENGYAYESNGSVYFDVEKFHKDHGYAEMAGVDIQELKAGAGERVSEEEMEEKKSPLDFALWIKADPGHLMKWNSPWSIGYPGWHIEDSAFTNKYFGKYHDIHGGGVDHIFPHHPNERAQDIAINDMDDEPVNYWLHTEFLTINGEKMSKSKGNFYTVRELIDKYDGEVLRMFFASSHYRKQIDFNEEALENAKARLDKLYNTLWNIENADGGSKTNLKEGNESLIENFEEAMDDDLDTPKALNEIMRFAKEVNKNLDNEKEILNEAKENILELGRVLGLKLDLGKEGGSLPGDIINLLVELRDDFREEGEYEKADEIRSILSSAGVQLEDEGGETVWKRK